MLATGAAFAAQASGRQAQARTGAAAAAATFTSIKVCGTDRIPYKGKLCKRDMRSGGLVFKEIDCSVRVTVKRRSTFSASISYRGSVQYVAHTVLKAGRHNELVGVRVNPSKMPGGPYKCAFRLGKVRKEITFSTRGPTLQLLGASVCLTPARKNGFCRADAAAKPMTSPKSVMCGGVFVDFAGKTWGIRLVRLTKTSPVLVGQYPPAGVRPKRLPGPISEQWVSFKPRTKAGQFRPAKYSCLYFANKRQVAEHSFTIKG